MHSGRGVFRRELYGMESVRWVRKAPGHWAGRDSQLTSAHNRPDSETSMHSDSDLSRLAAELAGELRARQHRLVTAESCTGGWVAKVLTEIPGSSAWYLGGVVSYSNALKSSLLGVQSGTLAAHGAVSAETAREMATGAVTRLDATCALSVTGIAGPEGGTVEKPVGLVWFGWAIEQGGQLLTRVAQEHFAGDRDLVRRHAVARALQGMVELASNG